MDLPKPVKIIIYAITFCAVAFGLHKEWGWFAFLFFGILAYAALRYSTTKCHHRYTMLPAIILLSFIFLFGIWSFRVSAMLGMAMIMDLII